RHGQALCRTFRPRSSRWDVLLRGPVTLPAPGVGLAAPESVEGFRRCAMASIAGSNHWWQNWSKTHAYVAERAFFPRRPEDLADAIGTAEADQRALRAVGGGWSFSDASLPGSVSTARPNVHVIDAFAAALPRTLTFPPDPTVPSVASVPTPARGGDA